MNSLNLVGRLVRDPFFKPTQNGTARVFMTLACEDGYNSVAKQPVVDFIPVVAWGKLATACKDNLKKGSLIAAKGKMVSHFVKPRPEDDRGTTYTIGLCRQIQFLSGKISPETVNSEDPEPTDVIEGAEVPLSTMPE